MTDLTKLLAICGTTIALTLIGCGENNADTPSSSAPPASSTSADHDQDHYDDHEHGDEVSLGTVTIGGYEIECWQAHGEVEPGKEMHLVVKLPFNDGGQTIVRAWIGTENRLASMVARADYSTSHDDYDVHAEAPDPLPENAMWWIEIERPDGSKDVGSIRVL